MIELNSCTATPLYLQLYTQLREQLLHGTLKSGDKLPSKRSLSIQLGVSVNTVYGAYAQLQSEGYIVSRPKSGYYVCDVESLHTSTKLEETFAMPMCKGKEFLVDFHPGRIAEDKFPAATWAKLVRNAALDGQALRRMPAQGSYLLRSEIAKYLYAARGVNCNPDQIVLGAGTISLLEMLSYLLDKKWTFAIENPVYNKAYLLFERMGHCVLPCEVDKQGVTLPQLEGMDNVVLYTTPSHQYPLGYYMPMSRRTKLLNWCAASPARYIVEDDYDSEFRYQSKPIPSLQGIDTNERVIYMGTFSRVISPAIRISYMVLPRSILSVYQARYEQFATGVSTLEQLALCSFFTSGGFYRHVNCMRVFYGKKREILLCALAASNGKIVPLGDAAGTHMTIKVRNGMSEQELVATAEAAGVGVYPISKYFIGSMPQQFNGKVLLGFGDLTDEEICKGVRLLLQAWKILQE